MPNQAALVAAIAVFALCSAVEIVRAETPEERQACTDDAFQHCGDAIPDRDRVYHCLVKKVRLISPACRKVITRAEPTNTVRR